MPTNIAKKANFAALILPIETQDKYPEIERMIYTQVLKRNLHTTSGFEDTKLLFY